MKKKTTEIAVNTSSGAEKVERIEKTVESPQTKTAQKRTQVKKTAVGEAALGGEYKEVSKEKAAQEVKKTNAQSSNGKAEQESAAAKARVDKALKRKEEQEKRKAERQEKAVKRAEARKKRMAEKKAAIEKRAAEKKARAEKHAAERKALAEKRKAEKEEKIRQRAHKKANRNNANYKKKKQREKTRSEKREHREGRNKGYGGWIAAVVSLGVVSLALATTVTVGAVEMNRSRDALLGSYKGTMYELTGIMDNVDNDLDRVRISNSPSQQSRILTDLLVQARLAELDLEKLPMAAENNRNLTSFINRTATECQRMLTKLRKGGELSKEDKANLEKLYKTNHAMRAELDKMTASMTDKDLSSYIKDGVGNIKDGLDKIEKSTIEENMERFGEKIKETMGAGAQAKPERGDKPHIEAAVAEELCIKYFTGYNVSDFQCVGETVGKGYEAYNVQGYDDRGNQLFAEISQMNGALLRFDYYEECDGEKFDVERAEDIAEEFLEKLGYDDMEVVRLRANGSTTDFTFVYEEDDVVYYPDEIKVKVCRTRGIVSGFDATKYLQNHRGRDEVNVKITLAEAYGKLYEGLDVLSSRVALVKTASGEKAAYEFLCSYGEEKYFVFLDATTGEEISIVNVRGVK